MVLLSQKGHCIDAPGSSALKPSMTVSAHRVIDRNMVVAKIGQPFCALVLLQKNDPVNRFPAERPKAKP